MQKIYSNITDAYGKTPLVKINALNNTQANIYAKLEFYNPAGSVKDRLGIAIINDAEKSGKLQKGGTIVEGTSGNTGIALAMVGAARGYRVILSMPETMSLERRMLLSAYGAELVLTPASLGMKGAVAMAKEIVAKTPGAILAEQFKTSANAQIHRETTAPEIIEDTAGKVDIFVAGVGTGGTITGVGEVLKAYNPNIKVVAVEPKDSPILSGGNAGPHKIQGIGANFIPDVLNQEIYDEVIAVNLEDSIEYARESASKEGILIGISGGAALYAAIEIAKREENRNKNIVVVLPDSGERYLSSILFEDLSEIKNQQATQLSTIPA